MVKASNKPRKRRTGRQLIEAMRVEVKRRLMEISDLNFAGAVLNWDQATYMPPGGTAARGRQIALLSKLAHKKTTDAALGMLLDFLARHGEELPYDGDDASLIRVARDRESDQAAERYVGGRAPQLGLLYGLDQGAAGQRLAAMRPSSKRTWNCARLPVLLPLIGV
jgi:carboxypeptidase Taq